MPSLLWSVSPQAVQDVRRLVAIAPKLQRRLARGLRSVGRTEVEIAALAARLGSLQQRVLDAAEVASRTRSDGFPETDVLDELPSMLGALEGAAETVHASLDITLPVLTEKVEEVQRAQSVQRPERHVAPVFVTVPQRSEAPPKAKPEAAAPYIGAETAMLQEPASGPVSVSQLQDAEWPLGTWVELRSERQQVRTKLTWVSPQQSLFLFTAEDGSTQSMTRRMRDKLLSQGQLRRLEAMA